MLKQAIPEDILDSLLEISEFCHEYIEPVFIIKNGKGDLAVMSMETYELLSGKLELYSLIGTGLDQVKQGKIKPMKESLKMIRQIAFYGEDFEKIVDPQKKYDWGKPVGKEVW